MIRKVIKQGHSTLTLTLPSKWVKQYNIQPGQELDLKEKENGLFVSAERKDDVRTTEIDLSELDLSTIWRYFMAAYREGYDEIKIKFKPEERFNNPYRYFTKDAFDEKYNRKVKELTPFQAIQQITNRFIGFEIISHQKDHCMIRDLSDISSKEFDSSLRRVFLLIQQMGEETLESFKTNNTALMQHTHDIDINVDKFHDYCIRVLNKTGFENIRRSHLIFSTLMLLELIGDEFKNIAIHLLHDMKGKPLKNLIKFGEMSLDHISKFYEFYYNFNRDKAVEISNLDTEIYSFLPRHYRNNPSQTKLSDEEREICNHLRRISKYINALTEIRIEMEF